MDNINSFVKYYTTVSMMLGEKEALQRWLTIAQWLNISSEQPEILNDLLEAAVYTNQSEIVEVLLERGAQVTQTDEWGNTLFSVAVRLDNKVVAERLLAYSVHLTHSLHLLNQPNHAGLTPFDLAQAENQNLTLTDDNIAICRWLVDQGAVGSSEENIQLSELEDKAFSTRYLQFARQQEEVMVEDNVNRWNLLKRFEQLYQLSVRYAGCNVQALLHAVLDLTYSAPEPAEWGVVLQTFVLGLLHNGAYVDDTALHLAAMKGNPIITLLLEQAGTDVNINMTDKWGHSLLDLFLLAFHVFTLYKESYIDPITSQNRTAAIAQLIKHGVVLRRLSGENIPIVSDMPEQQHGDFPVQQEKYSLNFNVPGVDATLSGFDALGMMQQRNPENWSLSNQFIQSGRGFFGSGYQTPPSTQSAYSLPEGYESPRPSFY